MDRNMMRLFVLTVIMVLGFSLSMNAQAQQFGDELCPSPDTALKQTPDDLSSIQSDIERFSLCVKRAELLQSLNSLAQKNKESLLGMPDIQAITEEAIGALPPLAPVDNAFTAEDFARTLGNDNDGTEVAMEDTRTPWLVNDIYGVGTNLKARITSTEGEIANVREGDMLSDGLEVFSISRTGIVLRGDENIRLDWARQ
jgi:type IV pilus biogenesis protein PilP